MVKKIETLKLSQCDCQDAEILALRQELSAAIMAAALCPSAVFQALNLLMPDIMGALMRTANGDVDLVRRWANELSAACQRQHEIEREQEAAGGQTH